MKKLSPRVWIAIGIQLMVVALLLPYAAILLGIIMKAAPDAMHRFASDVLSLLPLADEVQYCVTGINTAEFGMSMMRYVENTLDVINGNMQTAMYLGAWIYAFRMIFREVLPLPLCGLTILPTFCGLLMGALSYPMLEDESTKYLVIAFLMVLNIVVTLIFVRKSFWKKLLDILVNMALGSYLAALCIGYISAICGCLRGYYINATQAITAVLVVTSLIIIYLVTQFLVTDK